MSYFKMQNWVENYEYQTLVEVYNHISKLDKDEIEKLEDTLWYEIERNPYLKNEVFGNGGQNLNEEFDWLKPA